MTKKKGGGAEIFWGLKETAKSFGDFSHKVLLQVFVNGL